MSLERTAQKVGEKLNIDWEAILELLLDIINDCFSDYNDFVNRKDNLTLLDKIALGLRIRRYYREEGIRRPGLVRNTRKALIEEYEDLNDEEAGEVYLAATVFLGDE